MNLYALSEHINLAIGILTLGGLLWGAWKWLWPALLRVTRYTIRVFDSLDQLPAALNGMANVDRLDTQLTLIRNQVMPNGGSSMADAVMRLEKTVNNNVTLITGISKQCTDLALTMRAHMDTNPNLATFEAAPNGMFSSVNKTFLRWSGLQEKEIINWGWMNAVKPEQRLAVRTEWLAAVADVRALAMSFTMVDVDGNEFPVELIATPVPEGTTSCDKWVGAMHQARA